VHAPAPLPEVLGRPAPGVSRLVLVEPSAATGVTSVTALGKARPGAAVLLVGPEGGWAAGEVEAAAAAGWTAVSLGPRTLRAVSVPVVALTALSVVWRDL
jgi:RsmE family RNA methyltransferase